MLPGSGSTVSSQETRKGWRSVPDAWEGKWGRERENTGPGAVC